MLLQVNGNYETLEGLKERWESIRSFLRRYQDTMETWEREGHKHLICVDHFNEPLWVDFLKYFSPQIDGESWFPDHFHYSPKFVNIMKTKVNQINALCPQRPISIALRIWVEKGINISQIQNAFLFCLWVWNWQTSFKMINEFVADKKDDYKIKSIHLKRLLEKPPPTTELGTKKLESDIKIYSDEVKLLGEALKQYNYFISPPHRPSRLWFNFFLWYVETIIKTHRKKDKWGDIEALIHLLFKDELALSDEPLDNRKRIMKSHGVFNIRKWESSLPSPDQLLLSEEEIARVFRSIFATQWQGVT